MAMILLLLVPTVVLLLLLAGCFAGAANKNWETLLQKLHSGMLYVVSGVVWLVFLRFGPDLFMIVLRQSAPLEAVVLTKCFGILCGTSSVSIVFDILFANLVMLLCFLALPMMMGFYYLLYPTFVVTKRKVFTKKDQYGSDASSPVFSEKRILLFGHFRN